MDKIINYLLAHFRLPFDEETDRAIIESINSLNRIQLIELRHRLFNEALNFETSVSSQKAIFWLQKCFDLIDSNMFRRHHVYFSPGTEILESISELLQDARKTIDLCVFTITDERLASDILDCHNRGIEIRLITDDDKIYDRGSAVETLKEAGIPIKIDHSQYHMHHKFGIIDSRILFTGSFNWTYTASKHNQENLLVTSNYEIVKQYAEEYEKLWLEMFWL